MATNGILDITTEEYMGQDPEMQIDQDEMIEIIRTLQVIGIPQDKHPEVLEAFKEWKQTNAGTVDMFLEASLQLEPGTITKIKEQQVAQGPEDVITEEDMTIQPGSPDMQEIMQSVGAPQRAADGGIMTISDPGMGEGPFMMEEFLEAVKNGFSGTYEDFIDRIDRSPADYLAQGGRAGYDAGGLAQKWNLIREMYEKVGGQEGTGMSIEEFALKYEMRAEGGRAGYADGDVILPQPKPKYWERGDGSMKGMMGVNQNVMGLEAGAPAIYPQPKPAVPFIAQQQMQPFQSGVASVMPAGLSPYSGQQETFGQINNLGLQGMENVDMRVVMDFLMKMGMEPTPENIQKAVEALGVAAKYSQAVEDVNVDVDETIDIGYQDGGRAQYGLGDLVKKIFKAPKKILKTVKKIAKSPLGKAAIAYLGYRYGPQMFGSEKAAGKGGWGDVWNMAQQKASSLPFVGKKNVAETIGSDFVTSGKALPGTGELTGFKNVFSNAEKLAGMTDWEKAASLAKLGTKELTEAATPWYKNPWFTIPASSIAAGLYTAANPGDTDLGALDAQRDKEVAEWDAWLEQIGQNPRQYNFGRETIMPFPNYAKGGRINKAAGGIMDLDGMEKDYRNTGGFVEIGAKEKADDVPARLSVNEFVMTADAVRGAGDGDVEEGAQRLQDTMKQLEQKGKRHKAAQGMFATSQRLGEVI